MFASVFLAYTISLLLLTKTKAHIKLGKRKRLHKTFTTLQGITITVGDYYSIEMS